MAFVYSQFIHLKYYGLIIIMFLSSLLFVVGFSVFDTHNSVSYESQSMASFKTTLTYYF